MEVANIKYIKNSKILRRIFRAASRRRNQRENRMYPPHIRFAHKAVLKLKDRTDKGSVSNAAPKSGEHNLNVLTPELAVIQPGIEAAGIEELPVRALLYDRAVIHDEDQIRISYRGKPVRDNKTRPVAH